MNKKEVDRIAVILLHNNGVRAIEIVKTLKLPKSTVYDIIRRYKKLGTTEDRPRSGRPKTAVTQDNIQKIQEHLRQNPDQSIRQMAKELDLKRDTVRQIRQQLNMEHQSLESNSVENDISSDNSSNFDLPNEILERLIKENLEKM